MMKLKARIILWTYRNELTYKQYEELRRRIRNGECERALKSLAQAVRKRWDRL